MKFITRAFVPILVSLLIGIGMSSYMSLPDSFADLLLMIATGVLFSACVVVRRQRLLLVTFCLIGVMLGMLRFSFWVDQSRDLVLARNIEQMTVLRGVIVDEPDVREKSTQLSVALSGVDVPTTVLLITDRYPEYTYGDEIQIRGVLQIPEAIVGDDGRTFDYPNYLKTKGIMYQIFRPNITLIAHEKGNKFRATLFAVKHKFLKSMARVLPEPENALAGGILLGGKQSLGAEWTNRFRVVGIVHIIVLSGYNMTVVAEWLGTIFLFLGFYGSIAISSLGIICFALATGAGATVVRAAIMALLVLIARLTGKTYTMGRALLVAGVLMVLQNPGVLAFDPSFQLSFLAAMGLVFLSPILRARIRFLRKIRLLEEIVISTLATQILVLPLLLYQTGILSFISLCSNILVLPLIPMTMLTAFLTGLFGFLGYAVALIPALPAEVLLWWILAVGKYGAALPFAAVHLSVIAGWIIFLLYGVIAVTIYVLYPKEAIPPPQVLS